VAQGFHHKGKKRFKSALNVGWHLGDGWCEEKWQMWFRELSNDKRELGTSRMRLQESRPHSSNLPGPAIRTEGACLFRKRVSQKCLELRDWNQKKKKEKKAHSVQRGGGVGDSTDDNSVRCPGRDPDLQPLETKNGGRKKEGGFKVLPPAARLESIRKQRPPTTGGGGGKPTKKGTNV